MMTQVTGINHHCGVKVQSPGKQRKKRKHGDSDNSKRLEETFEKVVETFGCGE